MPATPTVLADLIKQSEITRTGNSQTATRVFHVKGVDTSNPQMVLYNCTNATGVPGYGSVWDDSHPELIAVKFYGVGSGHDSAYLYCTYEQQEDTIEYSTSLRQIQQDYVPLKNKTDQFADPLRVNYWDTTLVSDADAGTIVVDNTDDTEPHHKFKQYGSVAVMRPVGQLIVTVHKVISAANSDLIRVWQKDYLGRVNKSTFFDGEPHTWLLSAVDCQRIPAIAMYRVRFVFAEIPLIHGGWSSWVRYDQIDGKLASNQKRNFVTTNKSNGFGRFLMYDEVEFDDLPVPETL